MDKIESAYSEVKSFIIEENIQANIIIDEGINSSIDMPNREMKKHPQIIKIDFNNDVNIGKIANNFNSIIVNTKWESYYDKENNFYYIFRILNPGDSRSLSSNFSKKETV